MNATTKTSECIKVCVRVRPLLPREMAKDEVVYFPANTNDGLEVSSINETFLILFLDNQNRRRSALDREQV